MNIVKYRNSGRVEVIPRDRVWDIYRTDTESANKGHPIRVDGKRYRISDTLGCGKIKESYPIADVICGVGDWLMEGDLNGVRTLYFQIESRAQLSEICAHFAIQDGFHGLPDITEDIATGDAVMFGGIELGSPVRVTVYHLVSNVPGWQEYITGTKYAQHGVSVGHGGHYRRVVNGAVAVEDIRFCAASDQGYMQFERSKTPFGFVIQTQEGLVEPMLSDYMARVMLVSDGNGDLSAYQRPSFIEHWLGKIGDELFFRVLGADHLRSVCAHYGLPFPLDEYWSSRMDIDPASVRYHHFNFSGRGPGHYEPLIPGSIEIRDGIPVACYCYLFIRGTT